MIVGNTKFGGSRARAFRAFTLVELLIVVAIVAILSAIAVPNFLESQTRAKVARAKSELRALATAAEAYAVDWNGYPPNNPTFDSALMLIPLSTPIAYIADSHLYDPFGNTFFEGDRAVYLYANLDANEDIIDVIYASILAPEEIQRLVKRRFVLISVGPDRIQTYHHLVETLNDPAAAFEEAALMSFVGDDIYDPTNGTASFGDIYLYGAGFREGPMK